MSEKKPDNNKAKASYKSKGLRASGGRVPNIDTNSLESSLGLNITHLGAHIKRSTQVHLKKARALIRRAGGHSLVGL